MSTRPKRRDSSRGSRPARTRPVVPSREERALWVAAGGRCTLCNALVTENETLGIAVGIGEMAHNVGWGPSSPRGENELACDLRQKAENLLLLCRNCHKPVDDGGHIGVFDSGTLLRLKREHEDRIRFLTGIGAERAARVVRMVGRIRHYQPHLTRAAVLAAATAEGLLPQGLRGEDGADIDLDLRANGEAQTSEYFERCRPGIAELAMRVHDGVRRDQIEKVAVFAFARIPLLVELGARLGDKVETIIFQRQRSDDGSAWRWPVDASDSTDFAFRLRREGDAARVAVIVSLSGTIGLEELPESVRARATVYEIAPAPPVIATPEVIKGRATLARFESVARAFLAHIERDHRGVECVDLFPAVGLAAGVTLGRVLLPHISVRWRVFDRDDQRRFFEAMEVKA